MKIELNLQMLRNKNILWGVEMPHGNVLDYDVSLPDGEWLGGTLPLHQWNLSHIKFQTQTQLSPLWTLSSMNNLYFSVLNEHSPLLLCGPPGSGKTMTLFEALRKSPQLGYYLLTFPKKLHRCRCLRHWINTVNIEKQIEASVSSTN